MQKYRWLYLVFIVFLGIGGIHFFSSTKQVDLEKAVFPSPSQTSTPISPTLTQTKDTDDGKWWSYTTPSYSTPTVKTQNELAALLSNNAGCTLPCFLGVMPRETTLGEVEDHLLKYNIEDTFFHAEGYDSYGISSFIREKDTTLHLDIDFHVNNNVVSWIEISTEPYSGTELLSYYSLKEIVKGHGVPDHIYIAMEERFAGAYSLYIIYESKMAIYLDGWAKKENDVYFVCPNDDTQHMNMAFVSPSDTVDMRTLIYDNYFAPSLEEFINMTADDFYRLLLIEEPPCFTVDFGEQ